MIAAFDLGKKNFAFAVKDGQTFKVLNNINLDEHSLTKTDLGKYKKDKLTEMMANLNISTSGKINKKDMVDLIIVKNKKSPVAPSDGAFFV